jgi:hypothetical protein
VTPNHRRQMGVLVADGLMRFTTPSRNRRQRASVPVLRRYLPHHILTCPRLTPNVGEAEEGERGTTRLRTGRRQVCRHLEQAFPNGARIVGDMRRLQARPPHHDRRRVAARLLRIAPECGSRIMSETENRALPYTPAMVPASSGSRLTSRRRKSPRGYPAAGGRSPWQLDHAILCPCDVRKIPSPVNRGYAWPPVRWSSL